MKHVLLYFLAAAFLVTGGVLLWFNRVHPSTLVVVAVLGCMVFAVMLAAPAEGKQALDALSPFLKKGGTALPQVTAGPEVSHDE